MNQTTQMWMDSNRIMKRLMKAIEGKDKPDMEVIAAAQRTFEGQIKLINAHVAMFQTKSKNDRAGKYWEKQNLVGDEAIDLMLGDPEVDKVKCPEQEKLILRAECLEYSGKSENYEYCKGCEIGRATKQILLPENR